MYFVSFFSLEKIIIIKPIKKDKIAISFVILLLMILKNTGFVNHENTASTFTVKNSNLKSKKVINICKIIPLTTKKIPKNLHL